MVLAASMRAAWASFAASGNPSTAELPWPSFDPRNVRSLVSPRPHVETNFLSRHLLVLGCRLTTTGER
jgi:para-nitrobenzyl esterase